MARAGLTEASRSVAEATSRDFQKTEQRNEWKDYDEQGRPCEAEGAQCLEGEEAEQVSKSKRGVAHVHLTFVIVVCNHCKASQSHIKGELRRAVEEAWFAGIPDEDLSARGG